MILAAQSMPIPFFFFTAHWLLHYERSGHSPCGRCIAMGLSSLGSVFGRLILADG